VEIIYYLVIIIYDKNAEDTNLYVIKNVEGAKNERYFAKFRLTKTHILCKITLYEVWNLTI